MAKGDGLTHNQHYIPQVYLKGFSESNNSVFLNLTSCKNSSIAVPVKTSTCPSWKSWAGNIKQN